MSDIPPAPAKSPIVIIGLIALAGAVIALIGYIWTRCNSAFFSHSSEGQRTNVEVRGVNIGMVSEDDLRLEIETGFASSAGGGGILAAEQKVAERLQRLLLEELHHRVKNTLATVMAITSQSL